MTKQDDIKELLEKIASNVDSPRKHDVFDVVSKIGVTLCTVGIIWVATQITSLDKSLAVAAQRQLSMQEDVSDLKQFARKPRFTSEDFMNGVKPLSQLVDLNSRKIKEIGQLLKELASRPR